MLELSEATAVYLYTGHTDMRCGSNRLQGLVSEYFGRTAFDGSLYVFVSKDRKKVKMLYWERDGFWLFYKRLETSTFRISYEEHGKEEVTGVDLQLLLQGMNLRSLKLEKKIKEQIQH